MAEPRVGQTRMSGGSAAQINPDGTVRMAGGAGYEQIYLGRGGARKLGIGDRAGWYDFTKKTSDMGNRTTKSGNYNDVRSGKINYDNNNSQGTSFGNYQKMAPAHSKANNVLNNARNRAASNRSLRGRRSNRG